MGVSKLSVKYLVICILSSTFAGKYQLEMSYEYNVDNFQ